MSNVPGRPFQAGQSGNPAGRPKGSRHKLSESFLSAFCADFEAHGAATIERVRNEDPTAYVKAAVAILPKEVALGGSVELRSKEERDAAVAAALRADG